MLESGYGWLASWCPLAEDKKSNITNPLRRSNQMNFKERIAEVSHDNGVPSGDVSKVSKSLLRRMASLVEKGRQFKS